MNYQITEKYIEECRQKRASILRYTISKDERSAIDTILDIYKKGLNNEIFRVYDSCEDMYISALEKIPLVADLLGDGTREALMTKPQRLTDGYKDIHLKFKEA